MLKCVCMLFCVLKCVCMLFCVLFCVLKLLCFYWVRVKVCLYVKVADNTVFLRAKRNLSLAFSTCCSVLKCVLSPGRKTLYYNRRWGLQKNRLKTLDIPAVKRYTITVVGGGKTCKKTCKNCKKNCKILDIPKVKRYTIFVGRGTPQTQREKDAKSHPNSPVRCSALLCCCCCCPALQHR